MAQFSTSSIAHAALFWCMFIRVSDEFYVNVTSNQTYAEEGDRVNLTCDFEPADELQYQEWFMFEHSTICVETDGQNNDECVVNEELCHIVNYSECNNGYISDLIIYVVDNGGSFDSFGEWKCSIVFESRIVSDSVRLQKYVPVVIALEDFDEEAIPEELREFTCSVSNGNPETKELTWYLGHEIQEICLGQTSCYLELYIDRDMNGKELCCEAFQLDYKNNETECEILNVIWPLQIEQISITQRTSMSLTVTWSYNHGNLPPVNFTILCRDVIEDNELIVCKDHIQNDSLVITEEITKLKHTSTYMIVIEGINGYSKDQESVFDTTREQPKVTNIEANYEGSTVTVTWSHIQMHIFPTNQSGYQVTVQAAYYQASTPDDVIYNPEQPVNVEEEILTFEDDSIIADNYFLTLVVYENGLLNPYIENPNVRIETKNTTSAGALTEIIIICILGVAAVAIVAFVIYLKRKSSKEAKKHASAKETNVNDTAYNNAGKQDKSSEEITYDNIQVENREKDEQESSTYTKLDDEDQYGTYH